MAPPAEADSDQDKSREELLQELSELRSRLAEEHRRFEELSRRFSRYEEERYRPLVANMQEGLIRGEIILDRRGAPQDYRVLEANEAFGWLTGLPLQAARGKTVREAAPEADPPGLAAAARVAASGQPERFEFLSPLSGRRLEARAFRPAAGQFVLLLLDVTARRQAEEALRRSEKQLWKLLIDAPIPVLVYDEDGKVLAVSREVTRLTGYRAREVRSFEEWTQRVYGDDPVELEDVRRRVRRMFATGKPIPPIERTVTTRSGEERVWIFAEARPRKFGAGQRYHTAMAIDITERKAAEETLRRLNETLERQVAERAAVAEERSRKLQSLTLRLTEAEEKERLRIAEILHDDLQQMLAGIRFRLSMLRRSDSVSSAADPFIQEIDALVAQSGEIARRLSHDLSSVVLHRSGLPAAVAWLARLMKERHGLAVELEVADWRPIEQELLLVVLYRSIQELLFNAVKHAGVSAARVRLRHLADRVEAEVSDEGRGFDPSSLGAGRKPGQGFGLFGIQERIGSLGGRLEIDSAPGRGSRFLVSVPRPANLHPAKGESDPEENVGCSA